MASSWIAYNELAWTEDLLADPEDYEDEVAGYVDLIKRNSLHAPHTLLHLGCGAGGHDTIFKQHFAVTGVDISRGMLDKARLRHPDVEYIEGDMRTVRLGREFDAVVIPDSIDYMSSLPELRMAIETAVAHLKSGGIVLVVGKTREIFRDNNFAYTGEQEDLHVTLLENNYINRYRPNTYEAMLVYLIRRRGELTIHTECHVLGLFSQEVWEKVFAEAGLFLQQTELDGTYDKFLLGGGKYPLKIFIGRKY
ncbi:MAG TPA: class I SAM-dependent methyltransferase [Thermodesulfobacteriota bacterium]|nr:class I SAM-dependent methyltransferase [Deltaproteobacteria bacterium]HNR13675.1 class I SAM-dependent methyltransferase [Thermodesulfobacteriota bacterium]HQO78471.1 class I SAM-dependent methyltransferase [Thermodesulfobacteriota bacterium]